MLSAIVLYRIIGGLNIYFPWCQYLSFDLAQSVSVHVTYLNALSKHNTAGFIILLILTFEKHIIIEESILKPR